MKLTGTAGLSKIIARFIELTVLRHDNKTAALTEDHTRLTEEFYNIKVFLRK